MSAFRGFRLALAEVVRSGRADTSRLTCRASRASDSSPPLCGQPAAYMLTAACVHEHMVPSLACDTHTESARQREACGDIICTPCAHGPSPHRCVVTIEFCPLPAQGGV